jgi:murein DD-endopeptidase MepM/ murein hydrolase activator NlpD
MEAGAAMHRSFRRSILVPLLAALLLTLALAELLVSAASFAEAGATATPAPSSATSTPPSAACPAAVLGPEPYEQTVAATPLHCAKPADQCADNHEESVAYAWPADAAARAPRTPLLQSLAAFLSPPVEDPRVRVVSGWLYEPGRWHMAIDYGIDGATSFTVRAAAAGRAIFAGWDGFSGNTVIVSHDVAGERDAYRTIYMHLRNGAAHDCASSWGDSVKRAPQGSPLLAAYEAQLEKTGCGDNPGVRRPDPKFWGTDADTLAPDLLGRQVSAGAILGKAGDTGPGGFATAADPNVHLHVFFARRDRSDGAWVLFDPWGIYGVPACYPPGATRGRSAQGFPSAWK